MIKLPRGNTLDLSVMLYDAGGAPYRMKEKDCAIFTVKFRDDMSLPSLSGAGIFILPLSRTRFGYFPRLANRR